MYRPGAQPNPNTKTSRCTRATQTSKKNEAKRKEEAKREESTYGGSDGLKLESNGVRVLDLNIGLQADRKGRATLVIGEGRIALQALVVDLGQLENRKDDNDKRNDAQEQDETEAAGEATAGRANTGEAGEVFRLLLSVFETSDTRLAAGEAASLGVVIGPHGGGIVGDRGAVLVIAVVVLRVGLGIVVTAVGRVGVVASKGVTSSTSVVAVRIVLVEVLHSIGLSTSFSTTNGSTTSK